MNTTWPDLILKSDSAIASRSSLLIPLRQLDFFEQRCNEFGSRNTYFKFLLSGCLSSPQAMISIIQKRIEPRWKKAYQIPDQLLQKKSFTPDPRAWESFRNIAGYLGVSMCLLFVLLMNLDMLGQLNHPKFSTEKTVAWNSLPDRGNFPEKFKKFSIFSQKVDFRWVKLTRKHKTG